MNMPKWIVFAIAMVGCVPYYRNLWRISPERGPDGTDSWAMVTCVDAKVYCVEAASNACPHGYDTVETSDHTTQAETARTFATGNRWWAASTTHVSQQEQFRQEVLVHCTDGSLPQSRVRQVVDE